MHELRTSESHSAEYFGDTRDYWWNPDYIELIGRRLALRYFIAGGGVAAQFDALWTSVTNCAERVEKAIADRTYSHPGAALNYLVAGRKAAG